MKAKYNILIALLLTMSLLLYGCGLSAKFPATPTATPTPAWQKLADWGAMSGKTEKNIKVSTENWYLWYATGQHEGFIGPAYTFPRFLIKSPGINPSISVSISDSGTGQIIAQRTIVGDGADCIEINRSGEYQINFDVSGTWYAGAIGLQ